MQAIRDGIESFGSEVQYQVQSQMPYPGELFKKFSPAALKDLSSLACFLVLSANYRAVFGERGGSWNLHRARGRSEALDQFERWTQTEPAHCAEGRHSRARLGAVGKSV